MSYIPIVVPYSHIKANSKTDVDILVIVAMYNEHQ